MMRFVTPYWPVFTCLSPKVINPFSANAKLARMAKKNTNLRNTSNPSEPRYSSSGAAPTACISSGNLRKLSTMALDIARCGFSKVFLLIPMAKVFQNWK